MQRKSVSLSTRVHSHHYRLPQRPPNSVITLLPWTYLILGSFPLFPASWFSLVFGSESHRYRHLSRDRTQNIYHLNTSFPKSGDLIGQMDFMVLFLTLPPVLWTQLTTPRCYTATSRHSFLRWSAIFSCKNHTPLEAQHWGRAQRVRGKLELRKKTTYLFRPPQPSPTPDDSPPPFFFLYNSENSPFSWGWEQGTTHTSTAKVNNGPEL